VKSSLAKQGFEGKRVVVERYLNMRWEGTDTALMALGSSPRGDDTEPAKEDFEDAFRKAYKHEFGFLLEGKRIIVDDIKVRGIGKTFDSLGPSVFEELAGLRTQIVDASNSPKKDITTSVYFDVVGRVDNTPVFQLPRLEIGDLIKGPAMIIDDTQTIVVVPGATVTVTRKHLYITLDD